MDTIGMLEAFAVQYSKEMSQAHRNDDWDEQRYLNLEAKRVQREIGRIVQAVDTLNRYGIRTS